MKEKFRLFCGISALRGETSEAGWFPCAFFALWYHD
jgi:hypothetical protein